LALIEGCKHSLEITIPVSEIASETDRVVEKIREKAKLPGFRPGKVPSAIIKSRFQGDIRQEVLQSLVPKYFKQQAEADQLKVVGTPDVTDVHFEPGEPIRFKAEFEVAPEFELKEYRDLQVVYHEPQVTDADVEKRLEELREQKAEYINIDPRPAQDGDYAVLSLKSLGGVEGPPIERDELMLLIGGEDTLPDFTTNLRGMSPDEVKEFDVTYPAEYGQARLAGKTVKFDCTLKAIRRKDLPDLNDEFARDLGDYQNLDELRDTVRKALFREREEEAQRDAKNKLVQKLVDTHEFPLPEVWVNRQIELQVEQQLRILAAQGMDPRNVKLDWEKVRNSQKDRAIREVKEVLILDRIAEREGIDATNEEVDREVQRIAKREREPVAAVRRKLQKDGGLGRIANHFKTEKTLSFLFEQARKVAEE
jgi:trigger factor